MAGADHILIGSRSRSRLREAFVGSVTLKVLEESHLPVRFLRKTLGSVSRDVIGRNRSPVLLLPEASQ